MHLLQGPGASNGVVFPAGAIPSDATRRQERPIGQGLPGDRGCIVGSEAQNRKAPRKGSQLQRPSESQFVAGELGNIGWNRAGEGGLEGWWADYAFAQM